MKKIKGFTEFIKESNYDQVFLDPSKEDPKLSKDFNFHIVPGGKNNYRSSQMDSSTLSEVLEKYPIKNIIRLNGDGDDCIRNNKETPRSVESKICKANNCNFHHIDLEDEYSREGNADECLSRINKILSQGNTLIHCKYGKDRTGGTVASHLMNSGIIEDLDDLWEYTTRYNDWNSLIRDGKFFGTWYEAFASLFYPIEDLKRSKWIN